MTRETIIEECDAGVLLLTLNRPEKRNAFNNRMWCDLRDALSDAQSDDAVRAVIVTGAGQAFTAGQDIGELSDTESFDEEHGGPSCLDRLCEFDKPLIAAVNGVGIGFGVTLLLHFDYVYIARGARLRAPFVTLGIAPEAGSSYLLPALVGYRQAVDFFFESDFIDAERAVALGIATSLCEPDKLLPAALERARTLARKPLGALRWTKRLLLATRAEQVRAARACEDAAFLHRVGSPENVEAMTAFFEKREADFSQVPPNDAEPRNRKG